MNINENQNILITGGLGYIGMELAKLYSGKSRKCNVTVIDNNYYSQRVAQLKRWNIKFKQINILDRLANNHVLLQKYQNEFVIYNNILKKNNFSLITDFKKTNNSHCRKLDLKLKLDLKSNLIYLENYWNYKKIKPKFNLYFQLC